MVEKRVPRVIPDAAQEDAQPATARPVRHNKSPDVKTEQCHEPHPEPDRRPERYRSPPPHDRPTRGYDPPPDRPGTNQSVCKKHALSDSRYVAESERIILPRHLVHESLLLYHFAPGPV